MYWFNGGTVEWNSRAAFRVFWWMLNGLWTGLTSNHYGIEVFTDAFHVVKRKLEDLSWYWEPRGSQKPIKEWMTKTREPEICCQGFLFFLAESTWIKHGLAFLLKATEISSLYVLTFHHMSSFFYFPHSPLVTVKLLSNSICFPPGSTSVARGVNFCTVQNFHAVAISCTPLLVGTRARSSGVIFSPHTQTHTHSAGSPGVSD